MLSPAVNTVIKMIESLPDYEQNRVVDHLQEYILDLQDELQWDKEFEERKGQLINAAKKARKDIKGGLSKPLNLNEL